MMADDIDRGCELEEKYRATALAVRKPEGPRATGATIFAYHVANPRARPHTIPAIATN